MRLKCDRDQKIFLIRNISLCLLCGKVKEEEAEQSSATNETLETMTDVYNISWKNISGLELNGKKVSYSTRLDYFVPEAGILSYFSLLKESITSDF